MRIVRIILSSLVLVACASSGGIAKEEQESTITSNASIAATIGTDYNTDKKMSSNEYNIDTVPGQFAFELFKRICIDNNSENICISPASAKCALAMVANGAKGETLEQILSILGHSDGLESLNSIKFYNSTQDSEGAILSVANSIWINENFPVKEKFITDNQLYYKAKIANVPFCDSTVKAINEWCSQNTKGKIPSIISHLDDETKMLLLNAIYFNGKWKDEFSKSATEDAPFTKADGTTTNVKMMNQTLTTAYNIDDKVRIVSLPFKNSTIQMQFVLPHRGVSIKEATQHLAHNYNKLNQEMLYNKRIILSLPRFKCEYTTGLTGVLEAMGIKDAFNGRANFQGISDAPLYISDILQKSYLKINEEGAEAAAVTAIMVGCLAMRPTEKPIEVKFDRPFIYLIVDQATGNILFIGKTDNPQE